jgi:hypothetical protein
MKSASAFHVALAVMATATMTLATGCAKKAADTTPGDSTAASTVPTPSNETVRAADSTTATSATPAHAEWIRTEPINVKAIDANKDGKVFQCPMAGDYNVIADEGGTCPKCEMKTHEVTVEKAEENVKADKLKVEG